MNARGRRGRRRSGGRAAGSVGCGGIGGAEVGGGEDKLLARRLLEKAHARAAALERAHHLAPAPTHASGRGRESKEG